MIPGIIPVGVSTPPFSYKEGFAGSLANNGTVNIALSTPASPYRWLLISAGGGQSTTNSLSPIDIKVNGVQIDYAYTDSNQDSAGVGSSSTSHGPCRLPSGSSFDLSLSNSVGFPMDYTVGVFEIPVLNLYYAGSSGTYGPPSYPATGPIYQNGIVMLSQFGQGGVGTWNDMVFLGATKVPAASPGQEALAYIYSTYSGTFSTNSSNAAGYNRVIAVSSWAP